MEFPRVLTNLPSQLHCYWRHRWLVVGVAWTVAIIGWIVVAFLPDRYQAMTRIYVDTNDLLTPLLRNITVQTDVQRQIEVLQRTLLNRNNIIQVVHAADMDLDAPTEADKEALYVSLAKNVNIRAEGNNLFTVTYSDSDPRQAKKVVETLLSLFVETNLGQNRKNMESARNFIEDQIAEYEQKLKQADQRLAEYKAQHVSVLMATGANFSARLESARTEVTAAKAKYDEAVVARDQMKAHLASIPQFIDIQSPPQVVVNGNAPVTGSPRARVTQLETRLSQLRASYTEQHPDVIAAKRELESARQEAAEEAKHPGNATRSGNGRVSNPVYEQLMLRLVQADSEVAQAQSRLQLVGQEMQHLQALGSSAPQVEADLADLNREYGVVKQKYEEMLSRRESARISEAAENRGDKLQFRVVEAPQVPVRPSFPNRPLFVSGILLLAFAAGIGAAFLIQKIDDTVTSVTDLTEEFNLRVLGTVQKVENTARAMLRRKNIKSFGLASASLIVAYVAVLTLTEMYRLQELFGTSDFGGLFRWIRSYAG